MKTYTHKKVTITFDADRAHFYATAGGKKLNAPSIDSMKKKIDEALAVAFEPFGGFMLNYGRYEKTQIIGVGKNTYHGMVFHSIDGHERDKAVIDTPESRKLVATYTKVKKEGEAEIERIKARIVKAAKAIPEIRADAFAAKVKAKP